MPSDTLASLQKQKVGVVGAVNQTLAAMDESKVSRILALGKDVFFNDAISTDGSGNAQLMFLDKSALTIGPNASVVVDKFVYNPVDGGGELTMRGTKGAFRFIGGALSKKQEVKFKTPVGTIGIRGGIAIVEINPTSGATNATFLYGDKMTFQNLAGQKQETTNSGFAISLVSPTAVPSVPVAVDSATLAAKVTNFVGTVGQNGGATNVPTRQDLDSKSNVTGDGKLSDGKNVPVGESKQDGQGNGKTGANGGKQGSNGTNGSNTVGSDGGHSTADGGYIDSKGEYHTPAEVKAHSEDSSTGVKTSGMANGTNGDSTGTTKSPMMGDGSYTDANGVKRASNESNATGSTGIAATAGYNATPATGGSSGATATGGYYGAPATAGSTGAVTGGYASPTTSGYIAPAIGATAAGGYYSAPIVGSSAGGYVAPAAMGYSGTTGYGAFAVTGYMGGTTSYTAPAVGTMATAAYMPPAATYVAPVTTSTTGTAGSGSSSSSITPAQIAIMSDSLRSTASAAAIASGGTGVQATAAGEAAVTAFLTSLSAKNTLSVASVSGITAGNAYITTNITGGSGGGSALLNFDTKQAEENFRVNATNLGAVPGSSKYVTNNETAFPTAVTGTVAGTPALASTTLFKSETLNQRNAYKTTMASLCTTCSFVTWDAWAKVIPDATTTAANPNVAHAYLVPYVYGAITSMGVLPADISATYTGGASYNYSGSSSISTGAFTAEVNRAGGGAATVSNMNFSSVPGAGSLTSSGTATIGAGGGLATFSGLALTGMGGSYTGSANGALFGGATNAAKNIGGNMTYNGVAGGGSGAGVYLGARP